MADESYVYRVLEARLQRQPRLVVAVDGSACSGKTSLAAELFDRYDASVVHMDDFFLPRTPEHFSGGAPRRRLAPPIDTARFREQVIEPLRRGGSFAYDVFSGMRQAVIAENKIRADGLVVVEGAYSLLPAFGTYADLSVALTVAEAEQRRRIERREGDYAATFIAHWLPPEAHYFESTRLFERADCVIEEPGRPETTVYLARHGVTESNRRLVIQGQLDVRLSDEGRRQAERLAARAAHLGLDAVETSDLRRAAETAEIIASRLPGLDVSANPAWREIALGQMQGRTYDDCFDRFAEEMKTMKETPVAFQAPGGESGRQTLARVERALRQLLGGREGQRLLVVSHGFVLNLLITTLRAALNIEEEPAIARNTAVTKLVFRGGNIETIAYVNDARHLDEI